MLLFKMVIFKTLCILIDSANHNTTKKAVISIMVVNFIQKSIIEPMFSFSINWDNKFLSCFNFTPKVSSM